jgi:predicted O-methyltransferase YrrM
MLARTGIVRPVQGLDPDVRSVAIATKGFMPPEEGDALWAAAIDASRRAPGLPYVEVGSYCGRSTVWLGAAARSCGTVVHAVDHHGGSEENQKGWEWHDASLVDPRTGRIDTLPHFRATIARAGLGDVVREAVGESTAVAAGFTGRAALVFIDGGHGREVARADWLAWSPRLAPGGLLAIHDVFEDPADGGQAPFEEIHQPAVRAGFVEVSRCGSLRVLVAPA